MTRFRSVTNSSGETDFGPFLEGLVRSRLPSPAKIWRERTLDDPFERDSVLALVRRPGGSRRTVLLTGHYDTVSTANYGPELEPLACDPEALLPALIGALRASGASPEALRDFDSGEFLPGRGLLDMKGGLAAGLAVLRRFAEAGSAGSVLFAAVPDEEVASRGMRSLVRQLPEICRKEEIEIDLAINLDAEVDSGDGSMGRAIFLGSVGKMLPVVAFVGRPTHAGAPFDGVNPALLMAEFIRLVEANPEAGDPPSALPPPAPPTVLYARETRTHYDVTTPSAAYCAVNVLTHTQSQEQVLARFRGFAAETLRIALERLHARAGSRLPFAAQVMTINELQARCGEPATGDSVESCAAAMIELAAKAGIEGPAAIVGFAPPYYPRAEWNPADARQFEAIETARRSMGIDVCTRPYFPGISDMSFLNPADGAVRYPAVNIGPWGRDYHQRLERIHTQYAFEILPELLWRVVSNLLSGASCV